LFSSYLNRRVAVGVEVVRLIVGLWPQEDFLNIPVESAGR
jgi:hypothetical protein